MRSSSLDIGIGGPCSKTSVYSGLRSMGQIVDRSISPLKTQNPKHDSCDGVLFLCRSRCQRMHQPFGPFDWPRCPTALAAAMSTWRTPSSAGTAGGAEIEPSPMLTTPRKVQRRCVFSIEVPMLQDHSCDILLAIHVQLFSCSFRVVAMSELQMFSVTRQVDLFAGWS